MRNCSMKLPEKRQKYQEIDKYGYYTGAEILPSDQRLIFCFMKCFSKTNRKTGWYYEVNKT